MRLPRQRFHFDGDLCVYQEGKKEMEWRDEKEMKKGMKKRVKNEMHYVLCVSDGKVEVKARRDAVWKKEFDGGELWIQWSELNGKIESQPSK